MKRWKRTIRECGPFALLLALPAFARAEGAETTPAERSLQRFEAELAAQADGLKAREVGARAVASNPEVLSRAADVAAAAAKVGQATAAFLPKVTTGARYSHLSTIPGTSLGNLVATRQPGVVTATCPAASTATDQPVECQVNGRSVDIRFGSLVDIYSLQAGLTIPISDYVLRLAQSYSSASHSESAAKFTEGAARLKVARDAQVVFYNWARARAARVVAEEGVTTVRRHLVDARSALDAGNASAADVLRVQSQVAQNELVLVQAQDLVEVANEQLRIVLRDPHGTKYQLGEDLSQEPRRSQYPGLSLLIEEGMQRRLEICAAGETIRALIANERVAAAGYLPRIDLSANLYEQNPNTRYFPLRAEWHVTWDVGISASWALSDLPIVRSQVLESSARTTSSMAQRNALRDSVSLEITQAYYSDREAREALESTRRQLQSSEESFRVRQRLFLVGRATSVDLSDAENDLFRSRLDQLNARINSWIARVSLEHALGRDSPSHAPCTLT